MKIYMPHKRHKYGFKAYLICDSISSYVCNWSLYMGKDEEVNNTNINIVSSLCIPLEDENYKFFTDRFYSSPKLFNYLFKMGFQCGGTTMKNRLLLSDKIDKQKKSISLNV